MPLVARRKLHESWRSAVLRRGAEVGNTVGCLAAFERLCAVGRSDVEAAYLALSENDALSVVADGPTAAVAESAPVP